MVAGSRASCHRRQIGNQASEQLPVASPPSPMAIAEYADGKNVRKSNLQKPIVNCGARNNRNHVIATYEYCIRNCSQLGQQLTNGLPQV